jgi:hypothetical protein
MMKESAWPLISTEKYRTELSFKLLISANLKHSIRSVQGSWQTLGGGPLWQSIAVRNIQTEKSEQ